MLGRDVELAAIERTLDTIGDGFAAIIISGDPGIGKTTLWRHGVATAQARGYQVIQCRPGQPEKWLSFSGLADLLTGVPDEVFKVLPPPQRDALEIALLKRDAPRTGADHRAISTAVVSIVRNLAPVAPVVVAVDDLQWLDAATAEVLAYLLKRLTSERVLLLATVRDRPGLLSLRLDQVLDGDRLRPVRLGPLAAAELCELVGDRTGLMMPWPELLRLHEASGGNPLLAIEIARAMERSAGHIAPGEPLPVPQSIAALVTKRVSALPTATRAALLAASALAHPTLDQIRAAIGADAERLLESAEDHEVVRIHDGVVLFSHPLFSSAVYTAVPPARRRRMHRRLSGIVHDNEERAWHMALAAPGPDGEVAAAVEKAARAAQSRGALRTAARLWELASHRTTVDDQDGAARRTVAAALCVFGLGDARRARSMLEAVTMGMPPGPQRARVLLGLAMVLYHQSGSAGAAALCLQGLTEAGDDQVLRARLHLGAAWFTQYDAPRRVRHAEAAAAILEGANITADADLMACTELARGYYRFLAGCGADFGALERSRGLLPANVLTWERAWALYLACQWTKSLDLPLARAHCLAVLQPTADSGDEFATAHILFHLAETECWLGRLHEAMAHAAQAATGFEQTGQGRWRGLALYIRALPDAYLGKTDRASAAARRGLEIIAPEDDPYLGALHLGTLGFISLSHGELTEANRYLSRADELVASMGLAEPAMHRFHGDYLETVLALGDLARAEAIQQRLEDRLRLAPYPWLAMITTRGRALLHAAHRDLDAAADDIEVAVCHAKAAAMPFEHARTLLEAGRIRRRRKERRLAREALQQAQQIFSTLPSALWAAQANAEICRLGLRSVSPDGLTPTEQRVARLAANGHTNKQIAGVLHITEKTVEVNLSRVFRKLRIHSRRELTGNLGFA